MLKQRILIGALILLTAINLNAQKTLDNFQSTAQWKTISSNGTTLKLTSVELDDKRCFKLDADIEGTTGLFAIQKQMVIDFPQNYALTFYMRGEPGELTFEFNLIDAGGMVLLGYSKEKVTVGSEWVKYTIRQKDFTGMYNNPNIDRPMKRPEGIEFSFTSQSKKAVVYIADLTIIERPTPVSGSYDPIAFASSNAKGFEVSKIFDKNLKNMWKSAGRQTKEHILIDFREISQFGGIKIAWDSVLFAKEFSVSVSDNAKDWTESYIVKNGNGSISFVPISNGEGRYIKINMNKPNAKGGYVIKEVGILGNGFASSMTNVYQEIARMYPAGYFPRFYSRQNYSFRTFALPGDPVISAISSDGQVEIANGGFLLEPFIFADKHLQTWNEAVKTEFFDSDTSRVFKALRSYPRCDLTVLSFPDGNQDSSFINVHYTLKNTSKTAIQGSLYLALRPLSTAFHSNEVSSLPISKINFDGTKLLINDQRTIYLLWKPDAVGVCEFDQGDISAFLRADSLPAASGVFDVHSSASAGIRYRFNLKPGQSRTYYVTLPLHSFELPWYENEETTPDENWYQKELDSYLKRKLPR